MKKVFFSLLFAVGASLAFTACDNGDYSVGTGTVGVNPLNPPGGIDNSFNWGGNDPMSFELNGEAWKADEIFIQDAPSMNGRAWMISGMRFSGDTNVCNIILQKNVSAGSSVFVFYGNTDNVASFQRRFSDPFEQVYASTQTKLGEVRVIENSDSRIKALFFFLAKNASGDIVNVQKGYLNVEKP